MIKPTPTSTPPPARPLICISCNSPPSSVYSHSPVKSSHCRQRNVTSLGPTLVTVTISPPNHPAPNDTAPPKLLSAISLCDLCATTDSIGSAKPEGPGSGLSGCISVNPVSFAKRPIPIPRPRVAFRRPDMLQMRRRPVNYKCSKGISREALSRAAGSVHARRSGRIPIERARCSVSSDNARGTPFRHDLTTCPSTWSSWWSRPASSVHEGRRQTRDTARQQTGPAAPARAWRPVGLGLATCCFTC
jgi:hypothetical protein